MSRGDSVSGSGASRSGPMGDRPQTGSVDESNHLETISQQIGEMQEIKHTWVTRGTTTRKPTRMDERARPAVDRQARPVPWLEGEIQRLRSRMTELENEKADVQAFAAVAAHELLSGVVMIDAHATVVADRLGEVMPVDAQQDLDALRRSASRTRLLVETLLDHTRSLGRPLLRRTIDLDAVLRECLTVLGPEIRSRGAEIELGELPAINGDETLITALFTNLLVNALKYGPREGGTIRVYASREPADWRFFVQSQGPTIPVGDRERVFEPYHRGRGERRPRGAGLGLTICRNIVERHGGRVGVTTGDNGENSFFFTLPA